MFNWKALAFLLALGTIVPACSTETTSGKHVLPAGGPEDEPEGDTTDDDDDGVIIDDADGDGVIDTADNCETDANPDQADTDNDGIGNACDETPNGGGGTPPETQKRVAFGTSYLAKNDSYVERTLDMNQAALKRYAIVGFGASAGQQDLKGLFVKMKIMKADGTIGSTVASYKAGDMLGKSQGQEYVELPANFIATGFGVGTDSTGNLILAVTLKGVRVDSKGKVVETRECAKVYGEKLICGSSVQIENVSNFKRFTPTANTALRGLGFGIKTTKIEGFFARVAPIVLEVVK